MSGPGPGPGSGPGAGGAGPMVSVVTGASRGLGAGIASALAGAGFDVVVGYRADEEGARRTAESVAACGRRAVLAPGDVSQPGIDKLLLNAALELGPPESLLAWVNNAGVSVLAAVVDTDLADLVRMVEVNLVGTFLGLQAAARHFLSTGRPGRIVNVASDLGVSACRYLGGYAATKFAVVGLTQAAALELAASGITVNAVCPGTAETDMVIAERASETALTGQSPEQVRAGYLAGIPAGRFCTPSDVGAAVAWLCSPGAAYVTGQAVCINGGSVLH